MLDNMASPAELDALQTALGLSFKDVALLQQALTHRSYLHENPDAGLTDNERLEFLGDSLLGFIMAEKLYRGWPDLSEGAMTRMRATLVRRETLARLSDSMGLGTYIYIGLGEESSGGRGKQSILAGALEAVVAAVFLDGGLDTCCDFVSRIFAENLDLAMDDGAQDDYKSRLQELVQASEHTTPVYRTVTAEGPQHEREFTVEVSVNGRVLGSGRGKSKRQAEKDAARAALEGLPQD